MHICFITHEYPKKGHPHGGVGSFVKTLAVALVKEGVRVSVVGMNYTTSDETEEDQGVQIHRLERTKVKGITWYLIARSINQKIAALHKVYPIDIVETPELGLAFLHKMKGIQYVIRLHGGHHFFAEAEQRKINPWKGFQEKRSFSKADAFIAISAYVKFHTEKYLSYCNKPLTYIKNPINLELFKPIPIEVSNYKIVFVGTVCEKKGVRQLIQAFHLVKKEFPKATLEIYGRDWLFPNRCSYIQMLKETELPALKECAKDVFFKGVVDFTEVPSIYALASVCVFPSHIETLGLVAPEAMAMEKAVVFTNQGSGIEIIQHLKTGLLCNPYDPVDISKKISWVFHHQEEAVEMGKKARKTVLNKFDISILVKDNIEFYRALN